MQVQLHRIFLFFFIVASCSSCDSIRSQATVTVHPELVSYDMIINGAERTEIYFPLLEGKSVAVVCNHTSRVGKLHLIDALINSRINVKVILTPEHGFRGEAEAGAEITDGKDQKTGVKIISLYGKKKKPSPDDLSGIDLILFDIQDVGVRFYTYISTLTYVMEAAAHENIPVIVTDRPNPNGFYIDGPVLDTAFRSFVGLHPVPVVYGMTIGEYALMVNGEGWHSNETCDLTVIPLEGYVRSMMVVLPVKPSPNLPNWQSVYLYPSLCLFEGTIISVGRGTGKPFQVIGHPDYRIGSYIFTPERIPGVSENPPYLQQSCYGMNLEGFAGNYSNNPSHFNLEWLVSMHEYFKGSAEFFTSYFEKLAGTDRLKQDILKGKTSSQIRESWENDQLEFRKIRKKYLLYPDFD